MNIIYKVVRVIDDKCWFSVMENGGRFTLEYKQGEVTKADKNTLGIFCYINKKYAKELIDNLKDFEIYRILKVEGIGPWCRPKIISKYIDIIRLLLFYEDGNYSLSISEEEGIICYPQIRVIGDIK